MINMKKLIEISEVQRTYSIKRKLLEEWKVQFEELEVEAEKLSAFFQRNYENKMIQDNFPPELQELLENRLEGIRLSAKTATRLKRKLNNEKPLEDPPKGFIPIKKTNSNPILELVEKDNQSIFLNFFEEEVDEIIKVNRDQVELLQVDIEMAEKRFFQFIEKALAPIMDGLYNGKLHAKELVIYTNDSFPDYKTEVIEWVSIYEELMEEVNKLLKTYFVGLLIPEKGDYFDELKHDPIAVVEDTEYHNEQIKELVRYGYYYKKTINNQKNFIIRPAQVTVVKNLLEKPADKEKSGHRDEGDINEV
ncbi:nucleotide exchange factor GrpE [Alkalicoccus saliphilus]|uniref:Nucleotide exchange factor GrpE n=1 Tax=Alkalicoccus saliphilus TaxID=200989 RepID=A0A2T4U379_9BACI|nr:nucleotide exchange factor GrpE [Alkalicoccus saliphilus]PTL37805.1 nucleotide exchange factor GrpE [Alkalicoccus saliphilus]